MIKTINKDFYSDLPGSIAEMMDEFIVKYSDQDWFNRAWAEYRAHVLASSIDDMKMPGFVFNKYIEVVE